MITGEGLGRTAQLRFHAGPGHGALLNREQWLAGSAVEDVDVTLLARKDQRGHRASAGREIDEGGLRAEIIVPDVAVDGLKMPARFPGRDAKGDERGRVFILLRPATAAPVIRR